MRAELRRYWRITAGFTTLAFLGGCIPDDTFLLLRYAPDGQLLAIVSEKKGLVVADPVGMESRVLAKGALDPASIAWATDSMRIAYAGWLDGSLDLYLSALDGTTTRVTSLPARESMPMMAGNTLVYLSTDSGMAEFTSSSLSSISKTLSLPQWDAPIEQATISPDSSHLAWLAIEDLRPQIYTWNFQTQKTTRLTSESNILSLVPSPLQWSASGSHLGYLRDQVDLTADSALNSDGPKHERVHPGGQQFYLKSIDPQCSEKLLASSNAGIFDPVFGHHDELLYTSNDKLHLRESDGNSRVLPLDLPASLPAAGGDEGEFAFVAAGQLLGITTGSLERSRILTFDLEDKFLLAEEYFRSGSRGKSYDLYEELASSVQRTRDPQMARFVYIANLRRLGRTDKAVAEIEKLISEGDFQGDVPEKFLWRLLGFSYLLELDNLEKAKQCFQKYRDLTSGTENLKDPESAWNAYDIITSQTPELSRLYARAVKARLDANFTDTDHLFGELLTSAPAALAVQREYMNAIDGFDREVYFFSPTQRPFQPTRFQQAEYLERLVDLAPSSPMAREARLELFLLRIEMGSYSRARKLLDEALTSGSEHGRPEGILEVFRNYLETPEPQPWINQAMPEVFLHAEIRPRLEAGLDSPEDMLLLGVVATKMTLLQGDLDKARSEADAALASWNRIPLEEQSGDTAALYSRLLILRAREAELRGYFSEAADIYEDALQMLAEKHVDNFEFQEEIRFRTGLLTAMVRDFPEALEILKQQEVQSGNELVNPTWEPELLTKSAYQYTSVYDTTTGTMKLWACYEAGIAFGKLKRTAQARWAFLMASSPSAPEFLRRKATLELAALDEESDPWNAARRYAQIAAFPATSNEVRLWCSFQIARLHLSINYKIPAAREALALIVSNAPGTPLAIQSQELLVSTSTR